MPVAHLDQEPSWRAVDKQLLLQTRPDPQARPQEALLLLPQRRDAGTRPARPIQPLPHLHLSCLLLLRCLELHYPPPPTSFLRPAPLRCVLTLQPEAWPLRVAPPGHPAPVKAPACVPSPGQPVTPTSGWPGGHVGPQPSTLTSGSLPVSAQVRTLAPNPKPGSAFDPGMGTGPRPAYGRTVRARLPAQQQIGPRACHPQFPQPPEDDEGTKTDNNESSQAVWKQREAKRPIEQHQSFTQGPKEQDSSDKVKCALQNH